MADITKSSAQIKKASIRVSLSSYYAAIFVLLFAASFLLYAEALIFGTVLLLTSILFIPFLALFDRIEFDGIRLRRTGLFSLIAARFAGIPNRIRSNQIEQIDTHVTHTLRRAGRVNYGYRTVVRGRGRTFVFSSATDQYSRMIGALFTTVAEDVLDQTSIELRDHYRESRSLADSIRRSEIPSADVLDSTIEQVRSGKGLLKQRLPEIETSGETKAEELRKLANELRVTGFLKQSVEAFRRAVISKPPDGWLLSEFAKCLFALAGTERDRRMERRALAMLRLAEKRSNGDARLMTSVGESYFRFGEWRRAAASFKRTRENVGESYRILLGQAELALREGKIAHVIHNFAAANRLASNVALRRWSKAEVDYFSRLNDDEEYMELEISRMNLVDSLARWRSAALRIAAIGMPVIVGGIVLDDSSVANLGWAVSGTCVLLWCALGVLSKMLEERIPLDMVGED